MSIACESRRSPCVHRWGAWTPSYDLVRGAVYMRWCRRCDVEEFHPVVRRVGLEE